MIDKNNQEKHERNIHLSKKKTSDLGCDCLNWRLLDDTHLMENYEVKAIDLRKINH